MRKESETEKKAKVSVAWRKQLELLLQRKVAAQIAQEEEIWRMLETGREVMQNGIVGYGKGKVLEKCICMNCLRKRIKCKWDEGRQGKSESHFFFFFDFNSKNNDRKILPAVSETKNPMCTWRLGALVIEKAVH